MNNNTWKIVAPFGLFVVVAVGFGWRQAQFKDDADAARATTRQERARIDAELLRATQRLAASEKDQAELQSALDAVRKTAAQNPPAKTAAPPPGPTAPPTRQKEAEILAGNPDLRAALAATRRNAAVSNYTPLVRTLGLSGVQREKFEDLLAQREEARAKAAELMRTNDPADRVAADAQRKQDDEAFRIAQIGLLGEAGYEQMQQYERMLPVQGPVVRLAGATALAGIPMTAQQGEQLTAIMAKASASFQAGGRANYTEVNWPAVDVEARLVLSPEQFAIFSTHEPIGGGASRFGSQLGSEMDRARKKDASQAPKPPGN